MLVRAERGSESLASDGWLADTRAVTNRGTTPAGSNTGENATLWRFGSRGSLSLARARVIAILNITPDSFSDGGTISTPQAAALAAACAVEHGAAMLDIGGESTRPGAARVSEEEQIARVVPSIRAIRELGGAAGAIPISVDTTRSTVARAAMDAGADAINDVSAGLEDEGILRLAAERGAGVILMHRLRPPGEDSYSDRYRETPRYQDVAFEVRAFLLERARRAMEMGVSREAIAIDPGLGFGKSVEDNVTLVRRVDEFVKAGFAVLGAASRKSFVGRVSLGRESEPTERMAGSLAFAAAMHARGVRLFRVHDVAEHVEMFRVMDGLAAE
ncbi:MAG: dihydropteroate synthase [Phycisphaerales bacterium]|nr:dihydropteroate synthase [Phycisphaerales bacterium]